MEMKYILKISYAKQCFVEKKSALRIENGVRNYCFYMFTNLLKKKNFFHYAHQRNPPG